MPEVTATRRAYVVVSLRGQDTAFCIPCESLEAARATVYFAAVTWLRKAPQDRAGVWCITRTGSGTVVNESGIGEQPTIACLAAFDPREVVGVQAVERETEAWKEG